MKKIILSFLLLFCMINHTKAQSVTTVQRGGTNRSTLEANALLYGNGTGSVGMLSLGANGKILSVTGGALTWIDPPATGVTSVSLSMPGIFSVSGSPITSSGTFTVSLTSQNQNLFLASPNGSSGTPTFRSIAVADVPTLNQNTTGTASNVTGTVAIANGGTGQNSQNAALNALLPTQTGSNGKVLQTDGLDASWQTVASSGGTVTSVGAQSSDGSLSISGSPITTGGTFEMGIAQVKPPKIIGDSALSLIANINGSPGPYDELHFTDLKPYLDLSNTNSGDASIVGEDYLSIAGQTITAHPINLSTSNVTGKLPADSVSIADAGNYYTSTEVENALQEIGVSIGALQSVQPPPATGNQLISGGGVALTGNLDITVSAASYSIQGTSYASAMTNLTASAADPSNPRIDVVAVNASGNAVIITGTPAANPVKPDVDPTTELELTFLYIATGATDISGQVVDIYKENTEWTTSVVGNFNAASTNNPYVGTVCIEATAATSGMYVRFQSPTTIDLADNDQLVFYARSKATWANNRSTSITARMNGVQVGTIVTFKEGSFGFNTSNTSSYQQIIIPLALFGANGQSVNQIQIAVAGSGGSIGMYFDELSLQGGVAQTTDASRMKWRGNYNFSLFYNVNDVVISSGIQYVAIAAGLGNIPASSPTFWQASSAAGGGSGTVTSVGITAPTEVTVTNTPISTSGNIDLAWTSQTQNKVFTSPDGSSGVPTFRALVAADIPSLSYEVPLTFSTGLTRSTNTITVNTSQNIAKLSNLTSNGFVKTSGSDGTLSIDANTYLTGNQTITLSGDITGSGTTAITTAYNGTVPESKGGTNQTTYSTGNLLYASGANTLSKLAIGSTGNVLTVSGGVPTWAAPSFSGSWTGLFTQNFSSAKTNVLDTTQIFNLNTSGSPATSWGHRWVWNLDGTAANKPAGFLDVAWAIESQNHSKMSFWAMANSSVAKEVIRLDGGLLYLPSLLAGGTSTYNNFIVVKDGSNYVDVPAATSAIGWDNNNSRLGWGSAMTSLVGVGFPLHVYTTDATTNVTTDLACIDHTSSSTPAASYGTGLLFRQKSSTTIQRTAGRISVVWGTATDASRDSYIKFEDVNNTTTIESGRIDNGAWTFGLAGTTKGSAIFSGNTSGTVTISPAAAAGTYTLTLPTDDGGAGDVLQSDGSGVLSWTSSIAPIGGATDITAITAAGGTRYAAPFGTTVTPVAAYSLLYSATSGKATTLKTLYVKLDAAPGTGNTVVVTIYKNNATTGITTTISGNAATTGNDVTHTASVAVGDDVTVKIDATGTTVATTIVSWGFLN